MNKFIMKLACALLTACFCISLVNCSDPIAAIDSKKGASGIVIALPGNPTSSSRDLPTVDDVALYKVTVACSANAYLNEFDGLPGSTLHVSYLLPGDSDRNSRSHTDSHFIIESWDTGYKHRE